MVDRVVRVQLVGDATSLVREAQRAAEALRGIGSSSSSAGSAAASGAGQAQSAWEKFKSSVAGQVAIGDLISSGVEGAFGLLKDGLKQVITLGMDYESSMNTLSAVTGGNAEQMQALGDRAKQLGNDITIPGASARTAAAAMAELAKGGLDIDETMRAASGTLKLAAAAQIDGAQAAEIQANALNAFGLGADQADHVADLLANTANAASGEITDMASALQQSATVAAGFGISVDDTATMLALFAKNGLMGSDAGTSFKTMLTALASPTEAQSKALDALGVKVYDASGKFMGLEAVTGQLAEAKKRMTVEEYNAAASTAFGTDAIRAANIAGKEGVAGFEDMADKAGKYGGATDMAAAQSQGLTGAVDRLQNSAENVALTLFEKLSPALQGVADFGATAFGWLGDAIGWLTDLPMPIWAGVTAFGAMLLLKGPLTGFALAIKGEMLALGLQLQSLRLEAAASGTSMGTMGAAMRLAGISARAFGASLKAAFLSNPIGLAVAAVTTALSFMVSTTDEAAHTTADFSSAIDENTGALKENAPAVVAKALADSGSLDAAEKAGIAIGDYTQAVLGNSDAQAKIKSALESSAVELLKQNGNYENIVSQARRAKMGTDEYVVSLLSSGDAGRGAEAGLGDLTAVYSNLAADTGQMETQQRQTNQAIEGAKAAADGATPSVDKLAGGLDKAEKEATPFADALKAIRAASSEADAATQFLIGSLQQMTDGTISAEQMQRQNEAAIRAVTGATRDIADAQQKASDAQEHADFVASKLGQTLDGQAVSATNVAVTQADVDAAYRAAADASDAAKDATDRQADSIDKLAQNAIAATAQVFGQKVAQGDMQGAVRDATAEMESQRKKFIDTVLQINGGNIPAANELADKYGLIPTDVLTRIRQEGGPAALAAVQALRDEIAKLTEGSHIVKVAVESGDIVYTTASGARFKRDGGPITGPGGPRDDRAGLFHLSNGEFVSTAAAAAPPGNRRVLEWMHAGGVFPGMRDGGPVDVADLVMSQTGADLVNTGWQSAIDKALLEKAKKFYSSMPMANYTPGAGVEQWRGTVLQALGITGQPPIYANTVLFQMQTESGGNPTVFNLQDSNAQRGTPSGGLMQVIKPTFDAYALPPWNVNLLDPLSNIVASIRYVLARYGSIPAGMRGVAYDAGGVLPPGFTMAYNGTGKNEHVFTREQMMSSAMPVVTEIAALRSDLNRVMNRLPADRGVHIHGDIVNNSAGDVLAELQFAAARAGG